MPSRVFVLGGALVDLVARAGIPLVAGSSTPGHVHTGVGGVSANIARNLGRLGNHVELIAALGADADGELIRAACAEAGVGLTYAVASPHPTGRYVAIVGPDGELACAVNDMRATEALTPADLEPALAQLRSGDLLVADANLSESALAACARGAARTGVWVIADPVSVAKAPRLRAMDPAPWLITPNRDELAALTGAPVTPAAVPAAARTLQRQGFGDIWCRLGAGGSLLIPAGNSPTNGGTGRVDDAELLSCPARVVPVVDVTGAGDAASAAFIHATLAGAAPDHALDLAHAAAALTVGSHHSVRPDLASALRASGAAGLARPVAGTPVAGAPHTDPEPTTKESQ